MNSLIGVRNAAQQDRVVGGSQLIAAARWPSGSATTSSGSARRCAASSSDRDGVTVEADGVARARAGA